MFARLLQYHTEGIGLWIALSVLTVHRAGYLIIQISIPQHALPVFTPEAHKAILPSSWSCSSLSWTSRKTSVATQKRAPGEPSRSVGDEEKHKLERWQRDDAIFIWNGVPTYCSNFKSIDTIKSILNYYCCCSTSTDNRGIKNSKREEVNTTRYY